MSSKLDYLSNYDGGGGDPIDHDDDDNDNDDNDDNDDDDNDDDDDRANEGRKKVIIWTWSPHRR